jgi:hypothetical protein
MLKFFFTLFFLWLLARLVFRLFMPMVAAKLAKEIVKKGQPFQNYPPKNEYKSSTQQSKQSSIKDGEYVDFEEIKD